MDQFTPTLPAEWDLNNIIPFDSSETKQSYILRGKNNELQVKLSSGACSLVLAVHQGMSFAELAERMNQGRQGPLISPDDLRLKYEDVLARLAEVSERRNQQKPPWGFWANVVLIPKNAVAKIAAVLSHLYHPMTALCLSSLGAVALLTALHFGLSFSFQNVSFLSVIGPFLVLTIAHELGHASACSRFGKRPSGIGFAFYLIYPAFYSDVSSAWGLSRKQRMVVDLGGCYFQGIVTAMFLFGYYWTRWEPLRVTVIFSLYAAFTSLNPVFKFDGYWMLSDMLGVSNLANQPKRIARYLLDRVRERPVKELPWPVSITSILVIYSVVASLVWGFFVFRLFPMLAVQLSAGARAIASVLETVVSGKLPVWRQCGPVFQAMFSCVILLVMLWNIVSTIARPLWRVVVSRAEHHNSKPVPQTVVL